VLILLVTYVCLKAYWLLSMQFGRWTDAYWFEAALKCALWIPSCAIVTAFLQLGTGQSAGWALGLSAGARRGLLFGVVATMPMAAAALALPRKPLNPDLIAGSTMIGPFAEELLFRGFLFTLLVRRAGWHVVPAMILSSLIFGLAHLRNADVQFVSIVFGGGPYLTKYVLPYAAGGGVSGETGAAGFGHRGSQSQRGEQSLQRLFADAAGISISGKAEDSAGMAGKCETELIFY